jgi:LPXTG-site transpeptidase (sortase) family protein
MKLRLNRPTKARPYKISFSLHRNVVPAVLGVLTIVAVLGLLNAQAISAQVRYRFFPPEQIKISQNDTHGHKAPEKGEWIIIPKIGVKAPVNEVAGFAEWQVQIALRSGVVHYAGTADPGQAGNIVIFGHSSGPPWSPGKFNFVFTLLNKLVPGDKLIFDFAGQRYVYQMTSSTVVSPTTLTPLDPTTEPQLTLITCTPVGTSKNRLVVRARQISPNPATAKPIAPNPDQQRPKQLPSD